MNLKFGHIELFVKDVQEAGAFYRDLLGFEVTAVQGEAFVWIKLGQVEILLRPGSQPPRSEEYHHAAAGFVLYTDELEDALERLKVNNLVPVPMDNEPGCYTFTDLDGNWFQLVDPGSHL